jgi:hypothetical protein
MSAVLERGTADVTEKKISADGIMRDRDMVATGRDGFVYRKSGDMESLIEVSCHDK